MRCIAETALRPTGSVVASEPGPVLLRLFQGRDVSEISRIVAESLHEHYDPSLYFSLSQAWPDGFLIASDTMDRPVGFLLGVSQVPGEARVLMFAVDRNYRIRGVGTRLMDAFLERCRTKLLRRATLEVRVSNATAIRFYTRFAFSVTDLLRGYYSDGENGYQMAREVAERPPGSGGLGA
ncbi:MAG: GNAT family N-acetyltransferase [Thermoplasmata archaeon]|nr:GNAT family N-acetyltransferase [Thermoplasmata archaeon]MCI4359820.1 GNAT family N-acetyltransferase [Thermoplasmata archaeon]